MTPCQYYCRMSSGTCKRPPNAYTRSKSLGSKRRHEQYMVGGSRRVAPVFTRWVDPAPGARWIDIGCGTGVLTSIILAACEPSEVLGTDSSDVFLRSAAANVSDPRVSFKQGNAQAIPTGIPTTVST